MTERADENNLTGVWNGLYTYQDGRSTSFVATLIETGGSLTGTTHEPGTPGEGLGAALFATLVGSRHASAVTFTKTYDQPGRYHQNPIVYEGALSSDGSEIEGRWTIIRIWSGKFLMIRSPGRAARIRRKAFERA